MAKKSKQTLIPVQERWERHWQGMPEYISEHKDPWKSILVHFKDENDLKDFAKLIDQKITLKTKFIWHPKQIINKIKNNIRFADKGQN